MVHFPDEIWLKVAGYFNPPADLCTRESETVQEHDRVIQQTLFNACLVSKQLRAIFQPQLYCSFIKYDRSLARNRLLESESEYQHKYYQRSEQNFIRKATRLENFIHTLIRRPDLALMVKQLRIGWVVEDSVLPVEIGKLYERLPLSGTLANAFVNTLRSFQGLERMSVQIRRAWLEDLRNGEEPAEVALLLTMLPRLRCLRVESRRGDLGMYAQELYDALQLLDPSPISWTIESREGKLWKRPVKLQSQSQQPLQILTTLESLIIWSNCDGVRSLQRGVDLLSLPSLTSFNGRGLEQWNDVLRFKPGTTFASLQHLTLVHCKLSGSAIEDLLSECTRLRSLTLNSEWAMDPDEGMPILKATVFTAIQYLADSLERLTMMMPEYYTGSYLDLSIFQRLRYLEADQHLLFPNQWLLPNQGYVHMHKNLPTSIQQLVIRRTTTLIKPNLESLFDTFDPTTPKFPDLSALRLYTLRHEHDELEKNLIGFRVRAEQCRVDFDWEGEPEHNYWSFWEDQPDSESEEDLDSERGDSDSED